jgi:hypothetical protein
MRSILSVFGAEGRRRWASWLALALLVTLVGGTLLAGIVAARRTSSAFPDFVHRYGGDMALFAAGPLPDISHLRGVHAQVVSVYPAFVNGNSVAGSTFIPSNDLSVFGLPARDVGSAIKLLSGRLPTAPDEILAGFSLQQQAGLHVGSLVKVPMYLPSQRHAVFFSSNGSYVIPKGPVEAFRVVGFEASMLDFPTSTPSYTIFTSPAFEREVGPHVVVATVAFYRLANGAAGLPRFTYDVNHLVSQEIAYPFSLDAGIGAIEGSIHPQVVGWWLFALLAGIAGLALVGQALARQSIVERESFPNLSALGFTSTQLFWLGMARAAVVAAAGTAGAVLLAFLVSPLTPVGEAKAAEPVQGFVADAFVLGVGGLCIAVVVLVLASYSSWRGAQAGTFSAAANERIPRASLIAGAAARSGASAPMLIGIRHALERGRGRGSVPVATALLGTVAAVMALSATAVFSVSLTHLLDTPALYGQNWTVDLGGIDSAQAHAIATSAARMPGVVGVTYGVSNKLITVNGTSTNVMMLESAKGPLVFSVSAGRDPTHIGEIALGARTLADAHTSIGAVATIAFIGPTGKTYTGRLKVVGTIVFPPVVSQGGLGDGSVVALPTVFGLLCGTDSPSNRCVHALRAKIDAPNFTNWGMGIETARDAQGRATAASLQREFSKNLNVITVPTNLVNFGQAVNFPVLLGAMLAVFGAATLVHLLLVSVVRRRRELALLKVLGFVRRQEAAAVCWQSATVTVFGIVLGVPLGIAVGHAVWRAFASSQGAVPVSVVPVTVLAFVAGSVLAVGTLLALVPASFASRLRPAEALRES